MDFLQDPTFLKLVTELLAEPYSQNNRLGSKDLETICSEMEKTSQGFPSKPLDSSWERTYTTVCLLLAHLDLLGQTDFPEGSLEGFLTKTVAEESDSWLCRKTAVELCWDLRNELSQFFQPLEKEWNQISQHREQLDLTQWALVATVLKHQELAQALIRAGVKEQEVAKGGFDFSADWLKELQKDCGHARELMHQTKSEPSDFWENAA